MYVVVIVDSYCVGSLSLRTIDRHTGNMAKTTALCVYLLSPPLSLSLSHSHSLSFTLSLLHNLSLNYHTVHISYLKSTLTLS